MGRGVSRSDFEKYLTVFRSYGPDRFALIKIGGESIAKKESLDGISDTLACLYHLDYTRLLFTAQGHR
jgi:hypothetical protein